jgi:HK97 family phage major capsid protein
MVDQYVALARAARPTADACSHFDLPPGTDSIVLPKVSTGTATAIQTADNAAVVEVDLADQNLTAPVRTIAGQQDVALQVLDQSPGNVAERAFMADLLADYATRLDVQVLSGTGAAGQSTGILQTAGIGTVTYTDATPTLAEAYPKLASALSTIASARFLGCTHFVMDPRRWAWMLAALDTATRPLVVPSDNAAVNAAGVHVNGSAQGVVGRLLGCDVIADPSIPTTLGGGTEDIIIAARLEDVWLFESQPRFRVLPDVLSGNLTVRLQVYGYLAVHAGRYPSSVATIGGTGLIAPTF